MRYAGTTFEEFNKVTQLHDVLERVTSIQHLDRIPISDIKSLQADIVSLLKAQGSVDERQISSLRRSILHEINLREKTLAGYSESINATVMKAREALYRGHYQNEAILKDLKNNRVISIEEKTMEYLSVRCLTLSPSHTYFQT
jgi:hypothetical protein